MKTQTSELYREYDTQRKADEAREADRIDEAELKALERELKRRKQS